MFRYGQSRIMSLAVTEFALKSNFCNYFLQKVIRSYTITPSLNLCLSSWSLCCSCGWLWVWVPALEVQRRAAQTSSSLMPAECPQSLLTKVWHSPNDRTLWSEDIILFFLRSLDPNYLFGIGLMAQSDWKVIPCKCYTLKCLSMLMFITIT